MKKTMSLVGSLALALGLGAVGCKKSADERRVDDQAAPKVLEQRPADNTGTNERDRKETETTADNAGQSNSDVDIMAKIRRSVVDDDSLSTDAHNVKIVAEHGIVTLKGPVATAAERDAIVAKASMVVDPKNIVNQIEIALPPP
jgi:hyperosmotically inducible protein